MFHDRALNNSINDLHYRALRIIYQEHTMTFKEFLAKDGAVTIQHHSIQNIGIIGINLNANKSCGPDEINPRL